MRAVRVFMCVALVVVAAVPGHAFAQAACDDIRQQIDQENQQLDQRKLDAQPWLQQASNFAFAAPAELVGAAAQGSVPGLSPDLASSYGGIAAQVGAFIETWRLANQDASSDAYLRELVRQLQT